MLSDRQRGLLQDILENIGAIRRHVTHLEELSFASFESNELVVDAVERCLSRISEAAVKLGIEADEVAPGPQWGEIRGLGNHLRHAYHVVDLSIIWEIIEDDLPPLEEACGKAVGT